MFSVLYSYVFYMFLLFIFFSLLQVFAVTVFYRVFITVSVFLVFVCFVLFLFLFLFVIGIVLCVRVSFFCLLCVIVIVCVFWSCLFCCIAIVVRCCVAFQVPRNPRCCVRLYLQDQWTDSVAHAFRQSLAWSWLYGWCQHGFSMLSGHRRPAVGIIGLSMHPKCCPSRSVWVPGCSQMLT